MYYIWRSTLYIRWAGFDYTRTRDAAEYFNLVYYEHIRRAATTGVRRLHPGIKATEAKALRGATLSPLWLVDLTPGGSLSAVDDRIRAHNTRRARQILDDPRTARAVADPDDWLAFS